MVKNVVLLNIFKISKLIKLYWLLIVVVFIIDFISKFLVFKNFIPGETVSLFPLLNLRYVRNYGVAFNFFAVENDLQRWFLIGISIGVCMMLSILINYSKAPKKINNIAYALIIGGAIGNLADRLWHGFVVDMIDFYIYNWHFATFNFADSVICTGVLLIIMGNFYKKLFIK